VKNIDLQGLIDDFDLDKNTADLLARNVLQAVTATVLDNVRLVSGQKLRSTRDRYHHSISVAEQGPFCNIIYLADPLANMLESGATAQDMKAAMLKGPRVKFTSDGKPYLTVPFRHGTPGALAENASFSGSLPPEVYNAAKALGAYRSMPGGTKQQGQPLVLVPAPYDVPKTRAAITQNVGGLSPQQLAAYSHTSSIYSGLQRHEKTYEQATQNSYVTFRRVSLSSAVNAWIHPGLEAGNFLEQGLALTDIEFTAGIAAENTLTALGLL
jgi:hypothetical protein